MDQLITGGGVAGLVVSVVYVGRLALDWLKDKRTAPITAASAHVGDAATANAVLVKSLEALQAENGRLVSRVQYLEAEDARKDSKISELEARLSGIAAELAALKSDGR